MRQTSRLFFSVPHAIFIISIAALGLWLTLPDELFAAPADPGAGAAPNAGSVPDIHVPPITDLYALGLSNKPGESAEEILLRAHEGDTMAMALAVVGYDLGINGFPRDKMLAMMWIWEPSEWGAVLMQDFLWAYWESHWPVDEISRGSMFLNCLSGQNSPLAPLFKKAGLFDVEKRLAEITPEAKPRSPEEEAEYRDSYKSSEKLKITTQKFMGYFRAAAQSVLSREDEQFLAQKVGYAGRKARPMIYFAATTHDPEKEAPDWRTERLFSYIKYREEAGTPGNSYVAAIELMLRLSADREEAADIIRRAHAGELKAMRRMAVNYLAGDMGFVCNYMLAEEWYERAALAGDVVSMLALADGARKNSRDGPIWAWASLAVEYGDQEQRELAAWIRRAIEARISPDALSEARARLAGYREKIESRAPETAH